MQLRKEQGECLARNPLEQGCKQGREQGVSKTAARARGSPLTVPIGIRIDPCAPTTRARLKVGRVRRGSYPLSHPSSAADCAAVRDDLGFLATALIARLGAEVRVDALLGHEFLAGFYVGRVGA